MRFILLEPISSFASYLKRSLKQKLMKELLTDGKVRSNRNQLINELKNNITIDFDGHELSPGFFQSCLSWDKKIENLEMENYHDIKVIGITHHGRPSRDVRSFIHQVLKSEQYPINTLKLEPFWNKVDAVECNQLIKTIVHLSTKVES